MTISEFREERGISEEQMSDEEIRAAFPDEIDEDGDDELVRAAEAAVDRMYDYESGGDGASRRPEVNPQAGEDRDEPVFEGDEEETGFGQRSSSGTDSGDVSLKRDALETEGKMALNTIRMLRYQNAGERDKRNEAFRRLARGGHYGDKVARTIQDQKRANDYYNTLVDEEGGVLLPLTVRDEIDRLAENVGAFRQFARVVTGIRGTQRFPAASTNLKAVAIQEGGDIQVDRRSLEGVDLRPRKFAKGTAWTLETENEQIAQALLEDVQQTIANGFARMEDDAGLNGDGTSTYNNITGILNHANTNTYTLSSGNTNYSDIHPDDLKLANNDLPAGSRQGTAGKAFLFDETMEAVFATKKDDNNQYLFEEAFRGDVSPPELWGIPIFYTEELPGTDDSSSTQTDNSFGILAMRDKWIMGMGAEMTTSTLTEATVKDQSDNDIRLGSQDLTAQIFREWFDIGTNFGETAVIFKTAAS